jgi:hypothetical protein
MFTLGLPLSNFHVTCEFWLPLILQLYLFTTPLTWNVTPFKKHAWQRKSGDMPILSSMSAAKFLHAFWSLSFSAWIIWILYDLRQSLLCSILCTLEHGICNCKLAGQIDLRRLRCSASLMHLTFSSEVHVFSGDLTHNKLPVVLSLLCQNRRLFHIGGWCPYYILKWSWTGIRDRNFASHNRHWTCSCGVYVATELAEGHQLVHAHKPRMKKSFHSFPFWDTNVLFWIPFIQTP